jgi:putative solute:sodium symporter small subunit
MAEKEKLLDVSFFNPKRAHVKAEVKAASIILVLWALVWMTTPVLIAIFGDEKGMGTFLTDSTFLGFPLNYWLVAQGSTIGFVLLCGLFVILFNKYVGKSD